MKRILYLTVLLFLFSCHAQKEFGRYQKPVASCKPMLLLAEEANAIDTDPYQLDSLAVSADCLEVFVTYSGGCGGAEFELYYTNKVMYSMPPQTTLFMDFKDDDPCRSIVQDTLHFDLSEFKEMASSGGIWLRMKDSKKGILYSFSK
jgi:hypothetical protein